MSKYKVGDVVFAPISYFDTRLGYFKSQTRRWVIVKIDDTGNLTVSLTKQLHQAEKYNGIIVKKNSAAGIDMALETDTFIYCEFAQIVTFAEEDINRRIGICPIVNDIIAKLGI